MNLTTDPSLPISVETAASHATAIACAFGSSGHINADRACQLVADLMATFLDCGNAPQQEQEPALPAVSVKKSVTADRIYCMECGVGFKSLKRHLGTHHQLSPQSYRQKWSLPAEYPMVAPSYSTRRSELAKQSGLGTIK